MYTKTFFILVLLNGFIFRLIDSYGDVITLPLKNSAFDESFYSEQLDSELCEEQLSFVRNNSLLLIQFLEAGLQIPRSILIGNVNDFGNYPQCLGINQIIGDTEIQGKYCTIGVPLNQSFVLPELTSLQDGVDFDPNLLKIPNNFEQDLMSIQTVPLQSSLFSINRNLKTIPDGFTNIQFTLAVCVPKTCTTQEGISGLIFNTTGIAFEFEELSCRLPDDKPWVPGDYVAISVFSIIGLLTLMSTCYDIYNIFIPQKDEKLIGTLGRSFSLYTNTKRLMTFTRNPGALDCIDGIRAISMMWVILGHTLTTLPPKINYIYVSQFMLSLQSFYVTNSPIAVDSFFLISGLLLVYTTVGKLSGKNLLRNLHLFYLNRLLRMFPLLAIVILCQVSIFHKISDGPLWDTVASNTNKCRMYWWTNLIYLQNILLTQESMCLNHTWYLAMDMQLHILSPIILYWVLNPNKKTAWISLIVSFLTLLAANTIYNFIMRFPASLIQPGRQSEQGYYIQYYYSNTFTRASPFIVGMIFGYLLHLYRDTKVIISKGTTLLIWFLALSLTTACMVCMEPMKDITWNNQIVDSLVNSFMRPIWATALGCIIFMCAKGYGGPVNWFLSLNFWKLPSRLSYAIYLYHYPIMFLISGTYLAPIYFTISYGFYVYLGQVVLAFIVGFFTTLVFDSPFTIIFKMLLGSGLKEQKTETEEIKEAR